MARNNELEKTLWAAADKLRSNEEDDGIPFDDKMKALTAKLAEQFARGRELESLIRENLKGIGYEF